MPLFVRPVAAPEAEGPDTLRAALAAIDPDSLTPRGALEALYRLKALEA
jgi:DNA mismatch repair protein MutS